MPNYTLPKNAKRYTSVSCGTFTHLDVQLTKGHAE